jgi:CubicO group peptidase (beta-lactamase class C family)
MRLEDFMPSNVIVRIASILAVSSVWTLPAAAQSAAGPVAALPTDAAIRQILVERVDVQHRNVGIVVGIVTPNGRRVIPYGRFAQDASRPLDGDTVFEIGSVTKVFTSLVLADMVRRGEVSVADPVAKYLPAGVTVGSNNGRTITLADLATHTSALPFWPSEIPPNAEGTLKMSAYSVDELYQFLSRFDVPADVGTRWAYSNVDTGVLGLALARRANSASYEAMLDARVVAPLKMRSTAVSPSPDMKLRLAVGYDAKLQPAPAWNVPALAGSGSLHSSANDLLTLLVSLGDTHAATLTTMLDTRRTGPGFQQALGWWLFASPGGDDVILAHDGGTLGFASTIAYDRKARTGVVVLSNTANSVGDIGRHLLRPTFPLTTPVAPAPEKTEIPLDATLLDRYVGRYEPAPGVGFVVSREGDGLAIEIPGLPRLRLRAESERAFFVPENTRVTVTFDVSADGRVPRLLLRSPTGDVPAARAGTQP